MTNMLPSRRITRAILDFRLQRHVEQLRSAGFQCLAYSPARIYSHSPRIGGSSFVVRHDWDADQVRAVNAVLTLQQLSTFNWGLYE